VIELLEAPHCRIPSLLATGAPVYLTFNPVEYHGPHLSLHNDSLLSLGFIRELHARLQRDRPDWPLLFAGELETGVDPVPGPGSRPVPYKAALKVALTACRSLIGLGAKRVVLMTFHGSPLHNMVLVKCTELLEKAGVRVLAPGALIFRNFLNPDLDLFGAAFDHIDDAEEREAMRNGIRKDFHGGFLETSLSLHYAPDTVKDHRQVPPCPPIGEPLGGFMRLSRVAARFGKEQLSREFEFVAEASPWYRLRPFPGYTGNPHRAEARAGAHVAGVLVERVAECAHRVFSGEIPCPRPILMWVPLLTFYGRIGPKK